MNLTNERRKPKRRESYNDGNKTKSLNVIRIKKETHTHYAHKTRKCGIKQ